MFLDGPQRPQSRPVCHAPCSAGRSAGSWTAERAGICFFAKARFPSRDKGHPGLDSGRSRTQGPKTHS
eukprot:3418704-Pyramimonas_sp.AAC.1